MLGGLACAASTLLVLASVSGCGSAEPDLRIFHIRLLDPLGQPIAGAVVHGGPIDDHRNFQATSGADGTVSVHGSQRDQRILILAVSFFPLVIDSLEEGTYVLQPTPGRLEPIGDLVGEVLRMTSEEVLTRDIAGQLRHYIIHPDGLTERSAVLLRAPPESFGAVGLFGDELWLHISTATELEVWSVADPAAPTALYRIGGFPYASFVLARRGPLLVIRHDETSIEAKRTWTELWSLEAPGEPTKLAEIHLPAPAAALIGDALYLFPRGGVLGFDQIVVFDISRPEAPRETYRATHPLVSVSFEGDRAILAPGDPDPSGVIVHAVLDLTDPLHPVPAPPLRGDAVITQALSPGLALGFTPSPAWWRVASVIDISDGASLLATTASRTAGIWPYPHDISPGALALPYVAFAGKVWRLVEAGR
jgi:hypothetical protein